MNIAGFQPFTLSDYPGNIAAIVFTQGCNYRCPYCHNRALWPLAAAHPPKQSVGDLWEFLDKRVGLLDGVVVSGGEPTLQAEIADFMGVIKAKGFAVKLDTNGSHPKMLKTLLSANLLDYIAMDVKAPLDKYSLLCGRKVNVPMVVQSIELIASSSIRHHFRTTYFTELLCENDLKAIRRLLPNKSDYIVQPHRRPDIPGTA